MSFLNRLERAWQASDSLLTVGLDPDPARFPAELRDRPDAIYTFCRRIVDATAPFACAIKPQIAYFAAHRAEDQLQTLLDDIRRDYPGLVIILDAKRGDIGSTAEQYAREAFERYRADAVTVSPYLGSDSLAPYLAWRDRGVIVLCRTSNAGGADFQDARLPDGRPLYLHVAERAATQWNTHDQCALVTGATFPNDIAQVRAVVGDMPLLIPGIGAQGGDVRATVQAGRDSRNRGMMISSSRAILYASSGDDWEAAAAQAARDTRDAVRNALHT